MKKSKQDHLITLFKAGVSGIPVVGGPLASLIGDYVPSATKRSIEQAKEMFQSKINRLSDQLDIDMVNKDEFAELFKSCYLIILRSHQREKLRASTGLLVNILLKEGHSKKLTYTELDHFSRCLDILSIGAIEVLGFVVSMSRKQPPQQAERTLRLNFEDIQKGMEYSDSQLLMGLIGELNSMNLLHIASIPGVKTKNYGNYPIELTQLGLRFVDYVIELGEE